MSHTAVGIQEMYGPTPQTIVVNKRDLSRVHDRLRVVIRVVHETHTKEWVFIPLASATNLDAGSSPHVALDESVVLSSHPRVVVSLWMAGNDPNGISGM
jgi:hypothetical protein